MPFVSILTATAVALIQYTQAGVEKLLQVIVARHYSGSRFKYSSNEKQSIADLPNFADLDFIQCTCIYRLGHGDTEKGPS